MDLITPDIGLLFWMTLAFLIVFFVLKAKAWGPILDALHAREDKIESALEAAKEAKEEMARLQASNEGLLLQAREERDAMLKEAREIKADIIAKAEATATQRAEGIAARAMEDIELQKKAVMTDLKNQVAEYSLNIAEKVIKKDLSADSAQTALIDELVKDINLS